MSKKITIAIDGYSSCGKSTLAKKLAKALNYQFIDTGAMYRALTYAFAQQNLVSKDHLDEKNILQSLPSLEIQLDYQPDLEETFVKINGNDITQQIRLPEISALVSRIAAIKEVREKLVKEQRRIAEKGGYILDGRDIGSVVFPHAELKLFLTASPAIRAERRFKELSDKGIETTYEEVLKSLTERDEIDSNRKESPLIQTEDALVIDNSHMSIEEEMELILNKVKTLV